MFAKVFSQILDSSLAEDYQTRHVFEDLLKLCDINGVVDMTAEAIARRANAPLEIVKRGIAELEKPDPRSRNPEHEGRRIVRLDEHREWGWFVVNYSHYREIASEEQRREKTRVRVANYRQKHQQSQPCNAPVTPDNACNAMQTKMHKQKDIKNVLRADVLPMGEKLTELMIRAKEVLGAKEININHGRWMKRAETEPDKLLRVLNDTANTAKESGLTNPAAWAETMWKQFV